MCRPPAGGFFVSEKRGISEASFLFLTLFHAVTPDVEKESA